jgi:RHS repeat-associated protein
VTPDRLGSIGKYFPYGQERPSATTDGKEKFATYFRDSETGLDYADQRYHQPGMGRFMTADASPSSGAAEPGSWNRYAYTRGDPVNRGDPAGLDDCGADFCTTGYGVGDQVPGWNYDGAAGMSGGEPIAPDACANGYATLGYLPDYLAAMCVDGGFVPPATVTSPGPPLPPSLGASTVDMQQKFSVAWTGAWNAVGSLDCAKHFGDGMTSELLQDKLETANFVYGPMTNADGTPNTKNMAQADVGGYNVTINSLSGWATAGDTPFDWWGNSSASMPVTGDQVRTFLLLHELGHLAGRNGSIDFNNYNNVFSKEILTDCMGVKLK